MLNTEPAHALPPILIIDDDSVDIESTRRILKRNGVLNPLHSACDGVEAFEKLKGQNGQEKMEAPCLMLVDINMPRMNGLEFIEALRRDQTLKRNIVFILSTSGRNEERTKAYDLHVAGYILKENLRELAGLLQNYCQINKLPEDIKTRPC